MKVLLVLQEHDTQKGCSAVLPEEGPSLCREHRHGGQGVGPVDLEILGAAH